MLETRTTYPHGYTRLGNYEGNPFVVGNYWPNSHARPEVMNLETLQWETKTIYPYASRQKFSQKLSIRVKLEE